MMDEIPVTAEAGGDPNSQPKTSKKNPTPVRFRSRTHSPISFNLTREQALQQLETFLGLVHRISECDDVESMAACAAQITAQTMGDLSAVLLLEGRRNLYRVVTAYDEEPEALALFDRVVEEAASLPRENGWAATVLRSGEPFILTRVPAEQMEAVPLPVFQEYYRRVGIASVMILPMMGRSGVVGALVMSRHRGGRPYSDNDRQLADQIAFIVGHSLEAANRVTTLRREVSARLLATRALAASEQRFLSIFHSSPLGINVMDREGMVLEANAAFQALSGYAENDLIAMHFYDIVHPNDVHKVMDILAQLNRGGQAQAELEHRVVRRDGETVWLKTTFAVVKRPPADQEPDLIFGITEDQTARKKSDAELLELKQHLQGSIEMERLQLAQKLHDTPLQELYAVIYRLEELRLGADRENGALLGSIINDIRKTLDTLRSTASELRPPTLSRFGLEKAIRSYMQEFHDKHPGIQVKLALTRDRQSLPEGMRLVLFRVLQEAVANAERHAHATEIQVRFSFDAEEARLEVCDNGKGFDVPGNWMGVVREGHYGLAGMLERVTAAGGTLSVESAAGAPTTIRAIIPCQ